MCVYVRVRVCACYLTTIFTLLLSPHPHLILPPTHSSDPFTFSYLLLRALHLLLLTPPPTFPPTHSSTSPPPLHTHRLLVSIGICCLRGTCSRSSRRQQDTNLVSMVQEQGPSAHMDHRWGPALIGHTDGGRWKVEEKRRKEERKRKEKRREEEKKGKEKKRREEKRREENIIEEKREAETDKAIYVLTL